MTDVDPRETSIRAAAAAWALQWDGLTANPTAADDSYTRYLDLLAPGETDAMREAMSKMSGCALFARAYLRAVLRPDDLPRCLAPPYVVGHAVADVAEVARRAGAIRMPTHMPQVGDIVLVSQPEHVFIVTDTVRTLVNSIDGGQRSPSGHQMIKRCSRTFMATPTGFMDHAASVRHVVAVYDMGAMLRHYGVTDEMAPECEA